MKNYTIHCNLQTILINYNGLYKMTKRDDVFDNLCQMILGFIPPKAGKSYEIMVNCVIAHLNSRGVVAEDVFKNSSYSNSKYQLDGVLEDEFNQVKAIIEAKNYLAAGTKVGRDDILKLAGTLLVHKDVKMGIFASATDYTKPAKQYPEDLCSADAKPIVLYLIRPVEDEDYANRIMQIECNMHIISRTPDNAQITIHWGEKGLNRLAEIGIKKGDAISYELMFFYDEQGKIIDTLANVTTLDQRTKGTWTFERQYYLKINDAYIPFESIDFQFETHISKSSFTVKAPEPILYVRSEDGKTDCLISADDIKRQYNIIKSIE